MYEYNANYNKRFHTCTAGKNVAYFPTSNAIYRYFICIYYDKIDLL